MTDEFYYARDHDRGPGAWCVRGQSFYMAVPDKQLALAIAKFLSESPEATDALKNWKNLTCRL